MGRRPLVSRLVTAGGHDPAPAFSLPRPFAAVIRSSGAVAPPVHVSPQPIAIAGPVSGDFEPPPSSPHRLVSLRTQLLQKRRPGGGVGSVGLRTKSEGLRVPGRKPSGGQEDVPKVRRVERAKDLNVNPLFFPLFPKPDRCRERLATATFPRPTISAARRPADPRRRSRRRVTRNLWRRLLRIENCEQWQTGKSRAELAHAPPRPPVVDAGGERRSRFVRAELTCRADDAHIRPPCRGVLRAQLSGSNGEAASPLVPAASR